MRAPLIALLIPVVAFAERINHEGRILGPAPVVRRDAGNNGNGNGHGAAKAVPAAVAGATGARPRQQDEAMFGEFSRKKRFSFF